MEKNLPASEAGKGIKAKEGFARGKVHKMATLGKAEREVAAQQDGVREIHTCAPI